MSYYALTLGGGGGSGTVTSVSWTGGIVSIATATSTPAFTIAGTSGGIVYFDSATTWASSGVLTNNALIKGGGAGGAPSSVTTGTGVLTALGVNTGSAGAFVVNGGDLGTPSAGVVTNLTGTASININGTVGATTANTGTFSSTVHKGATSGTVTIAAPAVAGTQSYTLPSAVPAANGYVLSSTTAGVMSWAAAGSGSPGGSTTQVQYNSAGAFAGSANMTFNGTSLTLANSASIAGMSVSSPASYCTGLGGTALNVTTGAGNTGIGYQALLLNIGGQNNTAVGYNALINVTTGSTNVGIGQNGGAGITTGSANMMFGGNAAGGGYSPVFAVTTQDNRISMGSTGVTNAYVQVAWTVVSDARDKTDFQPIPHGLSFVKQLNPLSFYFKESRDSDVKTGIKRYGFKAQEILALEADDAVIIDNEDPEKLRYNGEALVPVLVKAIQELTARIEALEAKVV